MKKIFCNSLIISLLTINCIAQNTLTVVSNTEGFHVGLGASYNHWTSDYFDKLDEYEPTGLGGGINLGYGINQHLELTAKYDWHTFNFKESWDSYNLSTIGFGVKYNFAGTLQELRPFAEIGYNFQSMLINPVSFNGQNVEFLLKGGTFSFGAGVNYFVTQNIAINLNAGANLGTFSSLLVNNVGNGEKPDVKVFHVGIGVSYFFN